MPVIESTKDTTDLTLTIVSEFAASPERVWQVWEDPRQLERWWGPPEWPATFYEHNFREGEGSKYFMTGPDGAKMHGWWTFNSISPIQSLSIDDGFADEHGEPSGEHGTTSMVATLRASATGTRMTVTSQFESLDQLEEMIAMGMEQGMTLALGQLDEILAG